VWLGNEAMVQLLLTHGSDVTVRDKAGLSVLHLAAKENHTVLIPILLAAGSAVDAPSADRQVLAWSLPWCCTHTRAEKAPRIHASTCHPTAPHPRYGNPLSPNPKNDYPQARERR
jgi:hypothetical protein